MNKIRELLEGHIIDYIESDMTTVTVDKSKLKKVLSLLKDDIDLKFTPVSYTHLTLPTTRCV